ncbi:MAG: single-stranded DNA-binding protein [Actinobacteria bacterium 13_1_40CM_4_65_12]|nr:MAG: single-stranded DNA-binding protein [Actinobacteria bacterium 13_1_40CM_4_65_12]
MNKIFLIGRLTRDPELRYVPSGQPVANFTLAVDRPFKNGQGERETDFIGVVAWRKSAELVTQYLSKGRLVAVEGRLQIRSYEAQDGAKRKVAEVITDRIQFLDRKNGSGPRAEEPAAVEDETGVEAEPAEGTA